jgi:hypothetical protein
MAVYTILTILKAITFMTINASITKLGVQIIKTIHAVNIIFEPVTVVAILAKIRMHNQITI